MPPRRSTTRNSTATPAPHSSPAKRSTRGTSALPINSSPSSRVTRRTPQKPGIEEDVVNNPRLPEVLTQQSYAYGSAKTNMLPEQLVAREKMTLKEMAETIDVGVRQAEQQLKDHAADAEANLQQPEVNNLRQRASRERFPDESIASDNLEGRTKNRVAAWATSLDNNQLQDISEHDSSSDEESFQDDDTRRDTDPSSFPSGIFDHSYNYERGVRRPRMETPYGNPSMIRRSLQAIGLAYTDAYSNLSRFLRSMTVWTTRLLESIANTIKEFPESAVFSVLMKSILAIFVLGIIGTLFCSLYTNSFCEPHSSTPFGLYLQKYCGACRTEGDAEFNITNGNGKDFARLSSALSSLNQQMRKIETRLGDKFDSKYATMEAEMGSLRREQMDITNQIAHLGSQRSLSADNVPSPLIPRVNFFAPSNGALVDPRQTSPTRQKPFPLAQRVVMRMFGLTKYLSKPPITALEAWHETGDCWCSSAAPASEEYLRLGITIKEMVYPTELVVEHFPTAGTPSPDTAPRHVEIWADFAHLDNEEWQNLNIRDMQGSGHLGPTYGRIGSIDYDASARTKHVQAFRIDVNHNELLYSAQHFVIRVTSNHGSDYTCLYRVRMHGVPVAAHPEAKWTAEWHEKHGYHAE